MNVDAQIRVLFGNGGTTAGLFTNGVNNRIFHFKSAKVGVIDRLITAVKINGQSPLSPDVLKPINRLNIVIECFCRSRISLFQ